MRILGVPVTHPFSEFSDFSLIFYEFPKFALFWSTSENRECLPATQKMFKISISRYLRMQNQISDLLTMFSSICDFFPNLFCIVFAISSQLISWLVWNCFYSGDLDPTHLSIRTFNSVVKLALSSLPRHTTYIWTVLCQSFSGCNARQIQTSMHQNARNLLHKK